MTLEKARAFWAKFGGGKPPRSIADALPRLGELRLPRLVTVERENGYLRVLELEGSAPASGGETLTPVFKRTEESDELEDRAKGEAAWREAVMDGAPAKVVRWLFQGRTSRAGHGMLVVTADLGHGLSVPTWLDIEGTTGRAFIRDRALAFWKRFARDKAKEPPKTVAEALRRAGELRLPQTVTLRRDGQWARVRELEG